MSPTVVDGYSLPDTVICLIQRWFNEAGNRHAVQIRNLFKSYTPIASELLGAQINQERALNYRKKTDAYCLHPIHSESY